MIGYVLRFDNILLTIKKLIKNMRYGKTYYSDIFNWTIFTGI